MSCRLIFLWSSGSAGRNWRFFRASTRCSWRSEWDAIWNVFGSLQLQVAKHTLKSTTLRALYRITQNTLETDNIKTFVKFVGKLFRKNTDYLIELLCSFKWGTFICQRVFCNTSICYTYYVLFNFYLNKKYICFIKVLVVLLPSRWWFVYTGRYNFSVDIFNSSISGFAIICLCLRLLPRDFCML